MGNPFSARIRTTRGRMRSAFQWSYSSYLTPKLKRRGRIGNQVIVNNLSHEAVVHTTHSHPGFRSAFSNLTRLLEVARFLRERNPKNRKVETASRKSDFRKFEALLRLFRKQFIGISRHSTIEAKLKLFDLIERIRMQIESDFSLMLRNEYALNGFRRIASLVVGIRYGIMHGLKKDPAFVKWASEKSQKVESMIVSLSIDPSMRSVGRRARKLKRILKELSGSARIIITPTGPIIKIKEIDPESNVYDNPIYLGRLMRANGDFYFHSHPNNSEFSTANARATRLNFDVEVQRELGIPFLLYFNGNYTILVNGKHYRYNHRQKRFEPD